MTKLRQKYFFEKKLRNSDQIDSNKFRKISHKTQEKVVCEKSFDGTGSESSRALKQILRINER